MWLKYAFLRYALFFVLGIVLAAYYPTFQPLVLGLCLVIICFYVIITHIVSPEQRRYGALFLGLFSLVISFLCGFCYTQLKTDKNSPTHFSHAMPLAYYECVINSELQATKSGYKAEVIVKKRSDSVGRDWQVASGKLMLYFSCQDSVIEKLSYGTVLVVSGKPAEILPPLNPEEFDYRNYMANLQIHYYHFIMEKDFVITGYEALNPFWRYSFMARNYCDKTLKKYIPNPEAYGLATALVLGIKENLTDEVKNAYSNSGIMHILAVSGMHVTLLFQILLFVLMPFHKNKRTKFYVLSFALFTLWFYAFITGLSASVLRAVVMFTFILGADFLSRKPKIYNILGISAFVMCLFDPYLIFDVGFQLSYLAVFGIVFFHPLFYQLLKIPFPIKQKKENKVLYWLRKRPSWLLDSAWQVVCVSLAAQITTSPIALLYFHQFPNYFLLSNLFAIPVSTFVMYSEIALLCLSWSDFLATYIGLVTQSLILFLNGGVEIIEKIPYSVTTGVSLAAWEAWLLYLCIALIVMLFYYRQLKYLVITTFLIICWCSFQWVEHRQQQKQKQFIVYQTPKANAVEICAGYQSLFLANQTLLADKNKLKFHTANYAFKRSLDQINYRAIQDSTLQLIDNQINNKVPQPNTNKNIQNNSLFKNVIETNNFILLVYQGQKIVWLKKKLPIKAIPPADYWLISNNNFPYFPKQYTETNYRDSTGNLLITKPKTIIVNGTNKPYQLHKFKELALKFQLSCYFTQEKGAFILNIN
jgi:competence protein ComEC